MEKTETVTVSEFFRPRRLGHANLFVSSYEKAADFYTGIVGLEEVYRQPDNRAAFVSNGNTYHDFGLTDITSHYAVEGQQPGLNHLAFEVETEADLVEGYNRSIKAGVNYFSIQDHDVAHSLYTFDPDGNAVEVYADVIQNWREVRHGVFEKVKPEWVPGVTNVPSTEPHYPQNPELRIVPDSVFRARRVTHVAIIAENWDAMVDYYTGFVGMQPYVGDRNSDYMILRGAVSEQGVTLCRLQPGQTKGMHHVGIEVRDEADLDRALEKMAEAGIALHSEIDHPARRALTILDPDGIGLQFYVDRDWRPETLSKLSVEEALKLL